MRVVFKIVVRFLVGVLVLVGLLTSPIHRKVWKGEEGYQNTLQRIKAFKQSPKNTAKSLKAGWAKVNITPTEPQKLVGFKPRGPYQSVHDSLFVRVLALQSGTQTVCLVSYDLLLMPPDLATRLKEYFSNTYSNRTALYFMATHTHTSFGSWDDEPASRFITGAFKQAVFDRLFNQTLKAIELAKANFSPASIGFGKVEARDWVHNRLDRNEETDGWLRFLKVRKMSGEEAVVASYSAHATNISSKIWQLSRDYPGVLVGVLEQENTVDFALFGAGMVGSHRAEGHDLKNFEKVETLGKILAKRLLSNLATIELDTAIRLQYEEIKIDLPKPQLRLTQSIAVRSFIFETLLGELDASITYLKLGNILLLGMPCDFSGEIAVEQQFDKLAAQQDIDLMITSFNGKYIGYVTADEHYDTKSKEEVRVMNWIGPNMGAYFGEVVRALLGNHYH